MPLTRVRAALVALLAVLVLAGCGGPPPGDAPSGDPGSGRASPPPASGTVPAPPAPPPPVVDGPPNAALVVPDLGPVTGQLGTYTWGDGGSASPWLPGTPVTVSGNRTVDVILTPAVPVAEWRARFARAGTADGAPAHSLGSGPRPIVVPLPPPGRWTVELAVAFDGGRGDAVYYWQVEVR